MYQKPLLEDTIDFLTPSDRKQRGIRFHERYALSIYRILFVLFVGLVVHWYFFDYRFALVFGLLVLTLSISSEIVMKIFYGFSGRDATKYYATEMYRNPSQKNLKQLNSWNKNPFDLTTEYYYPRLGEIVETASGRDEPVEYVQSQLPDALRLIERRERDDYHVLLDIDKIEEYNLNSYYESLLLGVAALEVLLREQLGELVAEAVVRARRPGVGGDDLGVAGDRFLVGVQLGRTFAERDVVDVQRPEA